MSNEPISSAIGEKEKLQILLAEYNTLRAKIQTRTNNGFQAVAVGAAFIILLLQRPLDARFWLGLALFLIGAAICFWIIVSAVAKLASRIRQLEEQINVRASEELLTWERHYGAAQSGPYGWFVRAAKKLGKNLGVARYPC